MSARRLGFGHRIACIFFGEKKLTLKIAFLYIVAVDKAQGPYPRAGEQRSLHGTQSPAAHDHRRGCAKISLTFRAKRSETNLAAETVCLICHDARLAP
jgi:hypothetical protein